MSFLESLFNMADKKDLKRFNKIVDQIDAVADTYSVMTDEELQEMTPKFKERLRPHRGGKDRAVPCPFRGGLRQPGCHDPH